MTAMLLAFWSSTLNGYAYCTFNIGFDYYYVAIRIYRYFMMQKIIILSAIQNLRELNKHAFNLSFPAFFSFIRRLNILNIIVYIFI